MLGNPIVWSFCSYLLTPPAKYIAEFAFPNRFVVGVGDPTTFRFLATVPSALVPSPSSLY
ncbi:MAG: hypothetical protein SFU98_05305 [Leptospiraceae bacterium]|nr:hypothetical protein [Leptospiraceae bacterium]